MSLSAVQHAARRGVAVNAITRALLQKRAFHIENKVYQNMPFDYRNRKTIGLKIAAFLGTGFALPFVAVYWQQSKLRND